MCTLTAHHAVFIAVCLCGKVVAIAIAAFVIKRLAFTCGAVVEPTGHCRATLASFIAV